MKALAAGALLAAAALPMAIATAAGAADSITGVTFNTANGGGTTNGAYFGVGASGTFDITGAFAGDGGNTTVTSTAPGLTFTVTSNTNGTDIDGDFASTSATVPGTYSITVTDNAGTATETAAFAVDAAPTVSSLSVTSVADTVGFTAVNTTITGSGFVGTPSVTLTSTVDGTSICGTVTPTTGTIASPVSSMVVSIAPQNCTNGAPATPGTYTVTVINPDGGIFTTGAVFTVVGNEISALSPSALTVPAAGSTTTDVTVSGGGFESGATVAASGCAGVTYGTLSVTSASTAVLPVTVANTATSGVQCNVTITNTAPGNGASYTATGALGIGEAGALAPIITASSLTSSAALIAGAPASTVTFTGMGFSSFTTGLAYTTFGAAGTHDTDAVISSCINGGTGTSLTCVVTVSSGTTAGAHTALLENGTAVGALADAFTVDGPAITSASPAALAVNASIGTVVALTGTGFNNTTQGHVTDQAGGVLNGSFQYSSATTDNFVVTTSPNIHDNGDTVSVYSTDAYGAIENSAPYALGIDALPTVSSITYATGTSGVGVGATAQQITINGTGFQSGATVTAFVNGSAAADANVTAKVTGINIYGTQLTATVAVAAGDTNTVDGYSVTNPDGGVVKVAAVVPAGLTIDAAPTVTSVSPSTANASTTNALTITGTGFAKGVTVAATSDGTCGTATLVSSTSLTVSCTFGAEGTSAVSLVVTNLDGGTTTSAAVLPAATVTPPAPKFHVSAVHGSAVAGKTVTLTISGTGFYGQPKITSNAAGTKAVVSGDTGKLLTVHVTTPAGVSGTHTFTVKLANGKSGKVNYSVKK